INKNLTNKKIDHMKYENFKNEVYLVRKCQRCALLTLGLCKHNDSYVKVWSAESATSESK
ncbi:MAG: hypothetical protein J6A47_01115, partial [Bacilli bacterium]|nr:hypothetical protein [Bacilli bacterium]